MTINQAKARAAESGPTDEAPSVCGHARERMRAYGFTYREISELCDGLSGEVERVGPGGVSNVRPGTAVQIGIQQGRAGSADRKDVFLGVTAAGRPCVLVVTARRKGNRPRSVITLWDPTAPENRSFWKEDLSAPTPEGVRIMPPTAWFALSAPCR